MQAAAVNHAAQGVVGRKADQAQGLVAQVSVGSKLLSRGDAAHLVIKQSVRDQPATVDRRVVHKTHIGLATFHQCDHLGRAAS